MGKTREVDLADVYDELRKLTKLKILSLVQSGIQQKDIAATLEISPATLSIMFPKGVLKIAAGGDKERIWICGWEGLKFGVN